MKLSGNLVRRVAICAVMAIGGGGCAVKDDFKAQAKRISTSIEESRNESILLNIVRASVGHPIYFTSVSKANASNQVGGGIGLPSITFGPAKTGLQRQWVFGETSVNGQSNTGFDISPLDVSKEFQVGFNAPITLSTAHTLILSGVPREILFLLVVKDLEIFSGANHAERRLFVNDPDDPNFDQFLDMFNLAMRLGVTVETVHDTPIAQGKAGAGEDTSPPSDKKAGEDRQMRVCFDPQLAVPAAASGSPQTGQGVAADTRPEPICGIGAVKGRYAAVFSVRTRSTNGIFQYLGKVLASGRKIKLSTPEAQRIGPRVDAEFFTVIEPTIGMNCLVSVEYLDKTYCIPSEGAHNSARIIGILSQMIAFNTSIQTLPQTNTIRITP